MCTLSCLASFSLLALAFATLLLVSILGFSKPSVDANANLQTPKPGLGNRAARTRQLSLPPTFGCFSAWPACHSACRPQPQQKEQRCKVKEREGAWRQVRARSSAARREESEKRAPLGSADSAGLPATHQLRCNLPCLAPDQKRREEEKQFRMRSGKSHWFLAKVAPERSGRWT